MKIQHVKGNTCCTDIHGTCTGIYIADDNHIVLIDSGRYESPELFEWIDEEDLTVDAVIHTHLHIDHIANSAELTRRYSTRLYSSEDEPFEGYVEFESLFSQEKDFPDFRFIPTPGHSAGHQMIITPDNVGFAGDAILTEDFLEKTILPYMDHINIAICSMRSIKKAGINACVCSHNGVIDGDEIARVVDLNIQKENNLFELLEETVSKPIAREKLIDLFMKNAGIWNQQIRQYDYMIDTVSYRIDELVAEGRLAEENGMIISLT